MTQIKTRDSTDSTVMVRSATQRRNLYPRTVYGNVAVIDDQP